METPISKSQKRAMSLLSLPPVDSYAAAATALSAGYPGHRLDGIPQGHTWRTAAKLSDAELLAGIVAEEYCGMSKIAIAEIGY